MKLTLKENIRAFRKDRRLTQEQFAEAMGVTVGSVYKWETGQTIPELGMLVEIADFFDVSMDVLLGYRVQDNRIAAIAERLTEYCRVRDPAALAEAEKALKKYPNSFEVVHFCAQTYAFFGIGSKDRAETGKAMELFEQAKRLLSQNRDPEISEQTIGGEMASVLLILGEREKSIELMKQNNAGGIYSDTIGMMLALDGNRRREAEPFLAEALLHNTAGLVDSVIGYALILSARGEHAAAKRMLSGLITYMELIKNGEKADMADKIMASMHTVMAHIHMQEGNPAEAEACMRGVLAAVRRFDAAPDYGIRIFLSPGDRNDAVIADGLGATAAEGIETILYLLGNDELSRIWKELTDSE